MKQDAVKVFVQKNWYLVILLVVVVAFATYKITAPGPEGGAGPDLKNEKGAFPQLPRRIVVRNQNLNAREKAQQTIQKHKQELNADPQSERAPALLSAMGNLYAQTLGDDKEAIRCYEQVLLDYPNSPETRGVYVELASCYERIGDARGARQVYEDMMRTFPEGTEEHAFAQSKLRGE